MLISWHQTISEQQKNAIKSLSKIVTPAIDKIAAEGTRFSDAHSPAALCTPTRYGILTGRYYRKTRLKQWVILVYDEKPRVEKEQPNLGSLLQQNRYATACSGQWHVGMNWQPNNGYAILDDKDEWQTENSILRKRKKY